MLKQLAAVAALGGCIVACGGSANSASTGADQNATGSSTPQNLFLVSKCDEPCKNPAQPAPGGGTVYRSARPSNEDQIRFVRDQLGVTTIISLEELADHTEPEGDLMRAVAADKGRPSMVFMSASLDSMFTSSGDDAKIDEILGTLAAGTQNGAMMVHCALGRDRTGMIIALHRVINEHWAPQDAYDEWHAHGFDANALRKIQFDALYRYFIHRACPNEDDDGCVERA
jgi:hypothetical protein